MAMNVDEYLTKLIENNIEISRKHDEILNGMTRGEAQTWLKTLFEAYPVVWGIWRDPEKGFDMFPLKGNDLYKWSLT